MDDEMGMGERWDEGDGFWGMDGLEWSGVGKILGKEVDIYLGLPYLEHDIFLWEDGWLDGDLPIDDAWVEEWNC